MTIAPGSRIALLGRNGAGKSTLMKLLAGELTAFDGKRTEARDLKIGYFAQHQLEQLSVDDSPLDHLKRLGGEAAAKATEQELRGFLGSFGFSGDRVFEPVGPFSGGEKARLVLALVSYLRPNLLLLDEPTNHLDLEMRQALAMALQDYEAAVVLVSHDRHLLRAVADELILVDQGRAQPFDGDLDDYAKWFQTREAAETGIEEEARRRAQRRTKETTQARRGRASQSAQSAQGRHRADWKSNSRSWSRNAATVESALAEPDIYSPASKQKLQDLLQKQTQLKRDISNVETEWLAASEKLEAGNVGRRLIRPSASARLFPSLLVGERAVSSAST